jgi:branched-chain amino acid transport system substrate-binding protein
VVNPAKAYAQQQGFNVAFSEAYAPNTTDFSAILDKVIASKATVLMGGGHYPDGSTLARQLRARKASLKMITLLVAPDSPKWTELGDAAVGISVPSQWEPQLAAKPQFGPTVPEFNKAYAAKYNSEPSYESAGGYASGLVLQHAIEQAGGIDAAKVAGALNGLDATTFYGRTKFATEANQHGLQVGHTMVIAQWQKDKSGKLVKQVIWPLANKSANLAYPIQ